MQGITDLNITQETVLVSVITKSKTGVLLPRGEKWSTLPKSTTDSKLESGEA
jgi:hypothetical protein